MLNLANMLSWGRGTSAAIHSMQVGYHPHMQVNPEDWAACAQAVGSLGDLDTVLSSLKLAARCLLLRELLSLACQKVLRPACDRNGSASSW